ncbi:uncharacterized protein LOC133294495 [Gastrolobium bilobum]|uniref:uncharacterized protein LOC133294495 n=1 Tax=Gastrolobium bilobum TaxID=150636 RepID=UPI002AB3180A|nr:uncharacterized protein LOC133294495 [Gastrolobium bilobum]
MVTTYVIHQQAFLYTVIYASPREEIRKRLWDDLLQLSEDISVPWLIAGDFNEIAFPSEKRGGAPVDTSRYRACSNAEWRLMFHEGQVRVLPRINSDHNPILITLEPSKVDGVERPFRFHSFWLDHQFFNNFIKKNWRQDQRTVDSLRDFTPLIKQWNKDVFGNIHHKKNKLIGRLEGIQRAISEQNKSHLEKIEGKIRGELEQVLEQEELLWFEKSRATWIAQGDRNTKYYHTKTIVRRRRSKILELKDDAGNLIREDHNIARVINAYFSKLFSEENHDRLWVQTLWPKVDDETAINLGAPISKDEVRRAFFSMKDSKAPGEDGYTATFYKKNWEFIGEQIWRDIKYYAENPSSIEEVNGTLITLIPKVPKPMYVSQFRPISLCNVIYKGMSKIIVDRLKLTMENLVSPYQASFVPNRQLQDNIIVAKELVHSMGRVKGKKVAARIVNRMGFKRTSSIGRYLGSIVKQGRYIKADYGAIKDRIRSKLDGWKSHCLSFAGRVTLVKSVIAAIPSFHMQNGLLPVTFCDEIEQIQRAFIWGDQDSRRRAHLVLTKKDDLWVKILVAKYGRGQDLRRGIKAKSYDSKLWCDLAKCWSNFLAGLRWEIAYGSEVKLWTDNWLGWEENLQQLSSNQVPWEESQKSIANYMVDDGFRLEVVHQFLESDLADAVTNHLWLIPRNGEDRLVWINNHHSTSLVKVAYCNLMNFPADVHTSLWKKVWSWNGPERVKVFMWMTLLAKLSVRSRTNYLPKKE